MKTVASLSELAEIIGKKSFGSKAFDQAPAHYSAVIFQKTFANSLRGGPWHRRFEMMQDLL
jgi:hypothetical protein